MMPRQKGEMFEPTVISSCFQAGFATTYTKITNAEAISLRLCVTWTLIPAEHNVTTTTTASDSSTTPKIATLRIMTARAINSSTKAILTTISIQRNVRSLYYCLFHSLKTLGTLSTEKVKQKFVHRIMEALENKMSIRLTVIGTLSNTLN
jgi:hypothetical protein